MIVLFEAGRLTSYFAGMVMLVIAIWYFIDQWRGALAEFGFPRRLEQLSGFLRYAFNPKEDIRAVPMESLHRRSFAAGLCALGAFSVPLLYDFNVLLSERGNNPLLAVMAVYGLLFIQVSLVRTMAAKPNMAMLNFAGFYAFSLCLVLAQDAGFI